MARSRSRRSDELRRVLRLVDQDELEGVLAHELGHVKNRDMLLQTVSATLAGAITTLVRFGRKVPPQEGSTRALGPIATILAPIGAMVLQFAAEMERA